MFKKENTAKAPAQGNPVATAHAPATPIKEPMSHSISIKVMNLYSFGAISEKKDKKDKNANKVKNI